MDDIGSGSETGNETLATPETTTAPANPNVAPFLTGLGGGLSAYSTFQTGKLNQRISRFNAELSRIQARQAVEAGQLAANRREEEGRLEQGSARAAQAAGGTVVGAGTNRAMLDSIQGASAMDKMLIEINARRQAFGFQGAAIGQELQGDFGMQGARFGVAETLLDTGAQEELERDPRYTGRRGPAYGRP